MVEHSNPQHMLCQFVPNVRDQLEFRYLSLKRHITDAALASLSLSAAVAVAAAVAAAVTEDHGMDQDCRGERLSKCQGH